MNDANQRPLELIVMSDFKDRIGTAKSLMDSIERKHDEEINEAKAKAVMDFVNNAIGAFETGFIDSHEVDLCSLYRSAQHHVKDNYGIDTPMINEAWGKETAKACKQGDNS